MAHAKPEKLIACKIKVVKEVLSIYAMYRPEVGKIYDALRGESVRHQKDFVVLDILDKKIILRKGEYEEVCA